MGNLASKKGENDRVKDFAKMMVKDHSQFVQQLTQASGQSGGASGASGRSGSGAASGNSSSSGTRGASGASGASGSGRANPTRGPGGGQDDNSGTAQSGASGAAGSGVPGASGSERSGAGASGRASGSSGFSSSSSSSQSGDLALQLKQEIGRKCIENSTRELGNKQGAEFDKAYIGEQIVAHNQMLATLEVFQQHASGQLRDTVAKGIQTTQHHKQEAEKIMKELEAGGSGSGQAGASGQNRTSSGARSQQ